MLHMRARLTLGGGVQVGGRSFPVAETYALLDAVHRSRSLRAAADQLGLSYRAVWGRVSDLEAAAEGRLVVKTKGHGSELTAQGAALRAALAASFDRLQATLAAEERLLSERLRTIFEGAPAPLRIAASHDPLLTGLAAARHDLSLTVVGSEAALAALRLGEADIAGCHHGPALAPGEAPGPPPDLQPGEIAAAAFLREQGLILAPGNPLRIHGLTDVARTGARFVNRQRGSGTRNLLDRMLAEAAIVPAAIHGYRQEEFTHQAVAALVASGAADAGLGLRAVALAFGLAFVPLGWETYHLVRRGAAASPAFDALVADLRARAADAPGYRPIARSGHGT